MAVLTVLLSFLFSTPSIAQVKHYEIVKIEDTRGIKASGDLLNSICKKKIIHLGSMDYSFHGHAFKPGTGSASGVPEPTFWDMYDDVELGESAERKSRIVTMRYSGQNLHCFPLRGASDYYAPMHSDFEVRLDIHGKKGNIILSIGETQSITLKVKESDNWNNELLDIAHIFTNYYPFEYKLVSVDGFIEFQDRLKKDRGQPSSVREPVNVDLILTSKGEFYCLGFRCTDYELRNRSGGSHFTVSRRDAGFSHPVLLKGRQLRLTCYPLDDSRFSTCSMVIGDLESLNLSFDLSSVSFKNAKSTYRPTGFTYTVEIRHNR